jgi:hypothetical protein
MSDGMKFFLSATAWLFVLFNLFAWSMFLLEGHAIVPGKAIGLELMCLFGAMLLAGLAFIFSEADKA